MDFIAKYVYNRLASDLPAISKTEREALEAGNPWVERTIFQGRPNLNYVTRIDRDLGDDELEFIRGPVRDACEMANDYQINKNKDLPPELWKHLRDHRFFGMNIPKNHGGLEFSATAQSEVIMKLASRSIALAVTVMVPNSLGPAELIMKYGTEAEAENFLPKLATGEEMPCFALTGPESGSDAASTPDKGYIVESRDEIFIKVNIDKRYITLAPVATLVGVAVNLYDPGRHLDDCMDNYPGENMGLTVLLIPSSQRGLEIGDRHDPLGCGFMNGPVRGREMFIPVNYILGGIGNIGKGWKMLMECLAVGRGISLPALATGGAKLAADKVGAYSRVRKQFNVPIGRFEGVEEKLAQIAGFTHIMDSARKITLTAIDDGEQPSVLTAILKYNLTEMGRKVMSNAMDIQAGSAIMLGDRNYLGFFNTFLPISITVEGANILTRSLMIYGQGAMRSHPYILSMVDAARSGSINDFKLLFRNHSRMFRRNLRRALTCGIFSPAYRKTDHRVQIDRMTAAFALTSDIMMMAVGSSLKRKERFSGRLADILSNLYLALSVHRYEWIEGSRVPDYVTQWCMQYLLYQIQESFYSIFENIENRGLRMFLKRTVFPYGRCYTLPSDKHDRNMAQLLTHPPGDKNGDSFRAELIRGVFTSRNREDQTNRLCRAFTASPTYDALVARVSKCEGSTLQEKAECALDNDLIAEDEIHFLVQQHALRIEVIQVNSYKK